MGIDNYLSDVLKLVYQFTCSTLNDSTTILYYCTTVTATTATATTTTTATTTANTAINNATNTTVSYTHLTLPTNREV